MYILKCKRCGGRVMKEKSGSRKNKVELFCLMHGGRWFVDLNKYPALRGVLT